jgi:hypothetical protein
MSEAEKTVTPEESTLAAMDKKWKSLRHLLTSRRLSDPDAAYVRNALVEVMDIIHPIEPDPVGPSTSLAVAPSKIPVQVAPGVTIIPNDNGEATGAPVVPEAK